MLARNGESHAGMSARAAGGKHGCCDDASAKRRAVGTRSLGRNRVRQLLLRRRTAVLPDGVESDRYRKREISKN
jgi:hypothetical protein